MRGSGAPVAGERYDERGRFARTESLESEEVDSAAIISCCCDLAQSRVHRFLVLRQEEHGTVSEPITKRGHRPVSFSQHIVVYAAVQGQYDTQIDLLPSPSLAEMAPWEVPRRNHGASQALLPFRHWSHERFCRRIPPSRRLGT